MSRRKFVETFDRMSWDINDFELLFGGKIVEFGGDLSSLASRA